MKKLLVGLLGLVILIAIAAVVGPRFIDWNAYKDYLTVAAKRLTGRELAIAGDISLTLLPTPTLVAETLSLANVPQGSSPEMLRVRALKVRVKALPLLSGRIQVQSIDVVEPMLLLERLPDGTGNWETLRFLADMERSPGSDFDVTLDKLHIQNGTIVFRDADGERSLERVDADLTAASLAGPFSVAGTAALGSAPVRLEGTVGRMQPGAGTPVRVHFTAAGAEADLTGTFVSGDTPGFTGRVNAKGNSFLAAASAVDPTLGHRLPRWASQSFAVEAKAEVGTALVKVPELRIQLGDAVAVGSAEFSFREIKEGKVTLTANRLDLDAWLAMPEPERPKEERPPETQPLELPGDWRVTGSLAIEALVWRGGVISQVRLGGRLAEGRVAVEEATALLPGGSQVSLAGLVGVSDGAWRYQGRLEAVADNLRGVLDWLKLDLTGVPADRLRKFSLQARMTGTGETLEVTNLDMVLDASRITGGVAAVLRERPGFGIGLAIDQINLDGYLPSSQSSGAEGAKKAEPGPLRRLLGDFDANFNINVAAIAYAGGQLQRLHAEGTLQAGDLTVRDLTIGEVAGGEARLAGAIKGIATDQPRTDVEFDVSVREGTKLLQMLKLGSDAAEPIGELSVAGTAGGGGSIEFQLSFDAKDIGAKGDAEGSLRRWAPRPLGTVRLDLTAREPRPLARLLDIPLGPAGRIGALEISGEVSREENALKVDLAVAGPEAGAAGTVRGTATGDGGKSSIEGRLELAADKPAPMLRAVGLDPPPDAQLGRLGLEILASGPRNELAIDGKLALLDGSAGALGRLNLDSDAYGYDLQVKAEHPDLAKVLGAFGLGPPDASGLGNLRLDAKVTGDRRSMAMTLAQSQIGPVGLAGQGTVEFGQERWKVKGDVSLGETPLSLFLAPWRAGPTAAITGGGWASDPAALGLLREFEGEINIKATALTTEMVRVEQAEAHLALGGGVLRLDRLAGGLAGGKIEASGRLETALRPLADVRITLTGVKLTPGAGRWAGLALAGGTLDLGIDLKSEGASAYALAQGLAGGGRLKVRDGALVGVDLARAAERLKGDPAKIDAAALVAEAAGGGETPFSSLDGSFVVERGVVRSEDINVVAPAGGGRARVVADLGAWRTDIEARFSLAEHPDLPAFAVRIAGVLDAPQRTIEADEFREAVAKRAAAAAAPADAPPAASTPAPTAPKPSTPEPAPAPSSGSTSGSDSTGPAAKPKAEPQAKQKPAPPAKPAAEKTTDQFIEDVLKKLNTQP